MGGALGGVMLLLMGSAMALLLLSPTARTTIIAWLQGFDAIAGGAPAPAAASSTSTGTAPNQATLNVPPNTNPPVPAGGLPYHFGITF